jgi:hypothetical protein
VRGIYEIERLPVIVSLEETTACTETYGFAGTSGRVFLKGQRIVSKGHGSKGYGSMATPITGPIPQSGTKRLATFVRLRNPDATSAERCLNRARWRKTIRDSNCQWMILPRQVQTSRNK